MAGVSGNGKITGFCSLVCLASLLALAVAHQARAGEARAVGAPIGLESLGSTQPARPAEPKVRDTAKPQPGTRPSAARDEVSQLLMEDPVVPITLPKGHRPRRNKRHEPLPAEGTAVVNRTGRVHRQADSGWLVMTFDNVPGRPWLTRRRLLPCPLLEKIERIIATRPGTRFNVIGETTVYGRNAYLLLQRVAIASDAPAGGAAKRSRWQKATQARKKSTGQATARPGTARLLEAMFKDMPTTALRAEPLSLKLPTQPGPYAPAPSEPGPGTDRRARTLVVDRVVRLIKDPSSQWWTVRFQADNTLREPPMRVLPNSILARALRLNLQMGHSGMKLRVSGDVVRYKGRRYLLLRKMFPQRDMEQF